MNKKYVHTVYSSTAFFILCLVCCIHICGVKREQMEFRAEAVSYHDPIYKHGFHKAQGGGRALTITTLFIVISYCW